MLKTIAKIGNSQGIIFDTAIMEMAHLKVGDEVNVTVHEGGSIIMTPVSRTADSETVRMLVRETAKKYRKSLKRLA